MDNITDKDIKKVAKQLDNVEYLFALINTVESKNGKIAGLFTSMKKLIKFRTIEAINDGYDPDYIFFDDGTDVSICICDYMKEYIDDYYKILVVEGVDSNQVIHHIKPEHFKYQNETLNHVFVNSISGIIIDNLNVSHKELEKCVIELNPSNKLNKLTS